MAAAGLPPGLDRLGAGFHWGMSSAAYQIEGAVAEDGRGPSIWDVFSRRPGAVAEGATADRACDHYHRFQEDVAWLARLGVRDYRFSVAWPRIQPQGRPPLEPRGLAFYDRLVDALLAAGIRPLVTLYHRDLPWALEEAGGWGERDTAWRFAEYAGLVARRLGDRAEAFLTLHDPWSTAVLGHWTGEHAPGHRDGRLARAVGHHQLLAHAWAREALRAECSRPAGIALRLQPVSPAGPDEADRLAAAQEDRYRNLWFLEPLLRGRYPEGWDQLFGEPVPPSVREEELAVLPGSLDFLGVEYYTAAVVAADPGAPRGVREIPPAARPRTEAGWPVVPEGLERLLLRLKDLAPDLRLRITGNGAAFPDRLHAERVEDPGRIAYLAEHLAALGRAVAAGARVEGYYVRSLLDGFEWQWGYRLRYGLVYVDPVSLRRIPKASFFWYRDLLRALPA
ncbi:Thermostable beta-glucosidase B [Candidatus Hydrogenisulfobacillus filiaventi]|uniref:Beta-glucosidase n=1 Tax=Candidatus Hydrogenisulfobacillus filiaventi TaxID=2707344 RepID=A0A6F8ZJW6_9FIRM|nr:Thermostable beta-glucosidase B [Candidatus Hydrogenisulfobacillus filiaventi]